MSRNAWRPTRLFSAAEATLGKRRLERISRGCGASQRMAKKIVSEWELIACGEYRTLVRVARACGADASLARRISASYYRGLK